MAEKAKNEKPERTEIGFGGGQVIAARLDPKQRADLRKAVEVGEGWHQLETEDGTVALNLAKVVFIRGASSEHRVGFADS